MFKRISYTIALQFTVFVFILFLVNGAVFLIADISNENRQAAQRLDRTARMVMDHLTSDDSGLDDALPPPVRERVRVVGLNNAPIYSGTFFRGIPFINTDRMTDITMGGEQYNLLTMPFVRDGQQIGYVQVAEIERQSFSDLPLRALMYLLISIAVSGLTFVVGLFFARRSLKPAVETMQRLEQFTQDASHELRTPLAVLNSSLDLSLKSKKYQEGILSAKEDVKEISILVERLLELARLDTFTLERKPVDLSTLLTETAEKYTVLATEKEVTIKTHIAPNISVEGDITFLRQVVSNLLSNAIKFNKEKGMIDVRLQKNMLEISDTGIGIARSDLPHIFDRFYQADTSRTKEGFGLGLALVKKIIDAHGWTIDVKSTKKTGTTFVIHITR